MAAERFTAAITRIAWIRPDFTAASTRHTELADRHIERHGDAMERFARRQMQLSRQLTRMIAFGGCSDETRAHPFDCAVQRWKIDRDFVVEPPAATRERHRQHAFRRAPIVTRANRVVPHRLSYDRFATAGCQGESRVLASTPNMELRECPVCRERMRIQA